MAKKTRRSTVIGILWLRALLQALFFFGSNFIFFNLLSCIEGGRKEEKRRTRRKEEIPRVPETELSNKKKLIVGQTRDKANTALHPLASQGGPSCRFWGGSSSDSLKSWLILIYLFHFQRYFFLFYTHCSRSSLQARLPTICFRESRPTSVRAANQQLFF